MHTRSREQALATISTTSNHPTRQQARTITLAADANALLADGSVRWISRQDPVNGAYHHDYYHWFYVERDMMPDGRN